MKDQNYIGSYFFKENFPPTTLFSSIKHQKVITLNQRYFLSTSNYCKVISKPQSQHFTYIKSEVKLGVIVLEKHIQVLLPWALHGIKGQRHINSVINDI